MPDNGFAGGLKIALENTGGDKKDREKADPKRFNRFLS